MRRVLLGILMALVTLATPAGAQAPPKERQFVYGVNAFDGKGFAGTFYPRHVKTMYLMADVPNVVAPRYTLVYFWPITNEYRADWDGLNEAVQGVLEVLQGDRVVQQLEQTRYVIQYPDGLDGPPLLYVGQEAEARYARFQEERRAYRDRLEAYTQARLAYQEALQQAMRDREQGKAVTLPSPPEEPEPFTFFSTPVNDGFVLSLPAGVYRIRVRLPDGTILPESQRQLVVFSHRRQGIGYTVIPQSRWTTPEQADDPARVIYARPGTVMYLQPFVAREYNELYFTRLSSPQSTAGSEDRWVWSYLAPHEGGSLEVRAGGGEAVRVERRPYRVRQLPGPALGYEVLEYDPDNPEMGTRSPDFWGYPVHVEPGRKTYTIRLVDEAGEEVPGSARQVRVLFTANGWALFLVPLIPLTFGISVIAWRREQRSQARKRAAVHLRG